MRIDLFLSILKLLIQVKVIEIYNITSSKVLVYFAPMRYFYFENAISFFLSNIEVILKTSQIGSPIKSAISSKSRDPSENASTWLTMASKLDSFLGPPTVFLKSYLVKCGSPFTSQCGVTLSSKALKHNLANSKFMICPKGNGIDCHRNWEVLYMRRVPIMTRDPYLEVLFKNYPVLFVDKYSDITEELLLANDDLFQQAQTMDLSDLTLPKFFDNIVDRYVNT